MMVFSEEEVHLNPIPCHVSKKYFALFFPQILGKELEKPMT